MTLHAPVDFFRYVARPEDRGKSLEDILRDAGLSRRHIRRLVRGKKIRVNGKLSFLAKPIKPGDIIEADLREPTRAPRSTAPPIARPPLDIPILYEDPWVLVVNKPAGIPAHPTGTSRTSGSLSLTDALQSWGSRAEPAWVPHLVHRLDRETSGALLVAKAAHIHAHLDRLLRAGAIHRTYAALVEGDASDIPGRIDIPIAPDPHRPGRYRLSAPGEPGSKPAITLVQQCVPFPGDPTAPEQVAQPGARRRMSYLELTLLTGRTHQIRVHLSGLGHPVVGDRWYGTRYPAMPLMLHARSLSFPHPLDGRTITVSAPLPETWKPWSSISDLLNRKT